MEQLELMPARIKITSIVRKAILSGEFEPGEELSLTDTAAKLGVSRTPVREAFQTLASEGLIELRMNKGAVVKPIDETFITDHFGIRILLEGEAVSRAIIHKMDPKPLHELQQIIRAEQNLAIGNAYVQYNQEFHTKIWNASGSRKLYSFCEMLWNGPSYSRAVSDEEHRKKSIAEHEQIVSFIAQGKSEEGREAMSRHIERSMKNIIGGFKMVE